MFVPIHARFFTMSSDLLSRERQDAIRRRLQETGRVLAGDLARLFGVSEDTVRRDLREMAAAGLCQRVYGGALALPQEQPFSVRIGDSPGRKATLAAKAVTVLKDGMTLFVDAGSTNLAIVRAIPLHLTLTLSTNMPAIAMAALDHPKIDVITIGGRIDRHVGAAIGARAERDLEALRPDLCILGACGLDPKAGLTGLVYEDAEFKRAAAARSGSVLVAVTNEKLGLCEPFAIAACGPGQTLVLEGDAPAPLSRAFTETGVHLLHAAAVSQSA